MLFPPLNLSPQLHCLILFRARNPSQLPPCIGPRPIPQTEIHLMGSLPVKRSARKPEPNSLHALKYASVIVQPSGICKIGKEKPFFFWRAEIVQQTRYLTAHRMYNVMDVL
jgi:hypothetical protein